LHKTWKLNECINETPGKGFHFAIKLNRMAVKFTQPDDTGRSRLREEYENNACSARSAIALMRREGDRMKSPRRFSAGLA